MVRDRHEYVQQFIAAWHSNLTPKVRLVGRFVTRADRRNALGENSAPAETLNLLTGNVADIADFLQVSRDLVADIRQRHEAQSRSMSNILRHCPEFRVSDDSNVVDLETYLERKPAGVSPKFLAFCVQTNSKARFGVSFGCARHDVPPLNTFRAAPVAHELSQPDTSWRVAFLCAYQGHGVLPLQRVPRDPASMTPGMTPIVYSQGCRGIVAFHTTYSRHLYSIRQSGLLPGGLKSTRAEVAFCPYDMRNDHPTVYRLDGDYILVIDANLVAANIPLSRAGNGVIV